MLIISAVDYGYRAVIRVVHNPGVPEWVHIVGEQRRDPDGFGMFELDGTPVMIGAALVPTGESGVTCHNCRYNWDITEVILEGDDLYGKGVDGEPLRLADDELGALAFARVAAASAPRVLHGLVGRSD